ncbi:RNA polymerase sigma factor [Leucobacter sp. NPDC015123]|uniref:RNA polymerase sigma factor n=1 Tax=Leucobacter sp. NPDC015123 TaxID=3364129 RepID=UPI0036F48C1D
MRTNESTDAEITDGEIIARSRDRPDEFALLYRRRARAVFSYVASRLSAEAAEDITSATFLVALERLDRFDATVPNALPWLLGIATRLIRRHRRDEIATWKALAREGAAAGFDGNGDLIDIWRPDVDAHIDATNAVRRIAGAVASLAQRDRDVLALTAWSDLDSAGIADALGIPEGTVRSRLHRARRILRAHLDADSTRNSEEDHGRNRRSALDAQ